MKHPDIQALRDIVARADAICSHAAREWSWERNSPQGARARATAARVQRDAARAALDKAEAREKRRKQR